MSSRRCMSKIHSYTVLYRVLSRTMQCESIVNISPVIISHALVCKTLWVTLLVWVMNVVAVVGLSNSCPSWLWIRPLSCVLLCEYPFLWAPNLFVFFNFFSQVQVNYNIVPSIILNRPSHPILFMSVFASTTGRLHCELVRLLCLQTHRETDSFLAASGVQLAQSHFHYRRGAFSSPVKSKVGNILTKATALRINLNIRQGCSFMYQSEYVPSREKSQNESKRVNLGKQ